MFDTKKELRRMENRNKANEQFAQLTSVLNNLNKTIDTFYKNAKEAYLNNNEVGFELNANSMFYFQDIKDIVQNITSHFQVFITTAECMDTIEGIRPVLKGIAKQMNSYPSISQNNRDFVKFKKGLLKGQLNMKAMGQMMNSLNPATNVSRSKEDFASLKERISMETGQNNINTSTSKIAQNEDFFNAINKE